MKTSRLVVLLGLLGSANICAGEPKSKAPAPEPTSTSSPTDSGAGTVQHEQQEQVGGVPTTVKGPSLPGIKIGF